MILSAKMQHMTRVWIWHACLLASVVRTFFKPVKYESPVYLDGPLLYADPQNVDVATLSVCKEVNMTSWKIHKQIDGHSSRDVWMWIHESGCSSVFLFSGTTGGSDLYRYLCQFLWSFQVRNHTSSRHCMVGSHSVTDILARCCGQITLCHMTETVNHQTGILAMAVWEGLCEDLALHILRPATSLHPVLI